MRRVRTCAAVAVWISVMLSQSACTLIEQGTALVRGVIPESPSPAPPFPPGPPAAPPPAPSTTPPPPEAARAEIARWFSAAGYKDFQVEALVEHAHTESGFRPCARGAGDLSYTFQWGGLRLRRLHQFARTDGCPQLDTQLAFADNELRNEPRFSCFWAATSEPAAYAALRRGFGRGSC
jgi:hypothetical protein